MLIQRRGDKGRMMEKLPLEIIEILSDKKEDSIRIYPVVKIKGWLRRIATQLVLEREDL